MSGCLLVREVLDPDMNYMLFNIMQLLRRAQCSPCALWLNDTPETLFTAGS